MILFSTWSFVYVCVCVHAGRGTEGLIHQNDWGDMAWCCSSFFSPTQKKLLLTMDFCIQGKQRKLTKNLSLENFDLPWSHRSYILTLVWHKITVVSILGRHLSKDPLFSLPRHLFHLTMVWLFSLDPVLRKDLHLYRYCERAPWVSLVETAPRSHVISDDGQIETGQDLFCNILLIG